MEVRNPVQDQSPAPVHPSYELPADLGRASWQAMGTTLVVIAPLEHLVRATEITRQLFTEWEAALSRFLPESELSQLNARAGEVVAVSDLLWNVLTTALEAARASDGLYDPTLGKHMLRIGYDRSFEDFAERRLAQLFSRPLLGGDWQRIVIDREAHTIQLPTAVALDFGGIAKGMAIDAAIAALEKVGITSALVNAGGDLAVTNPSTRTWPVAIPGSAQFALDHGAMATSGTDRRRWQQGNQARHHLLDPRTGEPVANGVTSVTVTARRCAQAEVAAKVALILGPSQGRTFLQRWRIAGQFALDDGTIIASETWTTMEQRA